MKIMHNSSIRMLKIVALKELRLKDMKSSSESIVNSKLQGLWEELRIKERREVGCVYEKTSVGKRLALKDIK